MFKRAPFQMFSFRWCIKPINYLLSAQKYPCTALLCLVTQLFMTLCDLMECSPPGSSVHGDSPGKNTGLGCYALLQGIFPTQASNPGLPHWRQILYHPSQLDCLYFASELYNFLMYFGYKSLIRWLVWKYFLPFGRLSFDFADYFFYCTDSF